MRSASCLRFNPVLGEALQRLPFLKLPPSIHIEGREVFITLIVIYMDIKNEIKLAAEQLGRTKCPDCGGYHKVEIDLVGETLQYDYNAPNCVGFGKIVKLALINLQPKISLSLTHIPF